MLHTGEDRRTITMKGFLFMLRSSFGIFPILAMGTTQSKLRGMYAKVTKRLLKFTYVALQVASRNRVNLRGGIIFLKETFHLLSK